MLNLFKKDYVNVFVVMFIYFSLKCYSEKV